MAAKRSFLLPVVAALALAGAGCAAPRTGAATGRASAVVSLPAGDDGSSHVLRGETLRATMRALRTSRADRWPQELETERRREAEDASARIEHAAEAVQAAAKDLPALLPAHGLAPGEREEFERRAADLGALAGMLAQAARSHDPLAIRREEAALTAACHACHERFRPGGDESGVIDGEAGPAPDPERRDASAL